jgi:predicted 2-oxoglutarate/Fe(II)-dependent dioxygenase YbiX
MIQKYLPGVASSVVRAIQRAYEQSDWNARMGLASPTELGLRSAEFLVYNKTGRLGTHVDRDSIFTISVALSDGNDYEGGYFHLYSDQALFKVPRLSAVVFFSESDHGITPVDSGNRQVFVVELWKDDDTPIGLPRPGFSTFANHKRGHGIGTTLPFFGASKIVQL